MTNQQDYSTNQAERPIAEISAAPPDTSGRSTEPQASDSLESFDLRGSGLADIAELRSWLEFVACDDDPDVDPVHVGAVASGPGPSSANPLRGLPLLSGLAVVGAARMRELAAQPIDWAWKDYLVSGTICVMAGPSGGGKTSLLFLLLLARATMGQPVAMLGREVTPAPLGRYVVLIEAEHADLSTARKLVKSAELLGIDDSGLGRIVAISRKAVKLGSPAWREVERMIEAGIVSDVAIDTIARVGVGDANNEQEQAENFDIIAAAIERGPLGAQPNGWVVVHTRKGDGGSLDDVSGSMQRVGQADSVIMVRGEKDADGKITHSTIKFLKAREEPDDYPELATLTIAGGRVSMGSKATGPKGSASINQEHLKRVVDGIGEYGWSSVGKMAAALCMKPANIAAVCRHLESIGDMVPREPKPDGTSNGWELAGSLVIEEGAPWAPPAAA